MSGLLALLLGLAGAVYAAWPWVRRRSWPTLNDEHDVRSGEDMENIEKALREWSVSSGEVGVGALETIMRRSSAEASGE